MNQACESSRRGASRRLLLPALIAAWILPCMARAEPPARSELYVVGSAIMQPYVERVLKRMGDTYVMPPPKVELTTASTAIPAFCAGVGPEFPDIVAASRGMRKEEFETCVENGVLDIVEIRIGWKALYAVVKKGNPAFDVSARTFYLALAKQVPIKGEFVDNTAVSWRDTSRTAPDLPINVLLPDDKSGTRNAFDSLFMESGCRRIKEIDAIYSASDRVTKCVGIRKDKVSEIPEPYGERMMKLLEEGLPGTVAIMSGEIYATVRDRVEALPVGGVLPTDEAIQRLEYLMVSGNHFYFKRAHIQTKPGGPGVPGVWEFMSEATGDGIWGVSGEMSNFGMVALRPGAQAEERRKTKTLQRFVR